MLYKRKGGKNKTATPTREEIIEEATKIYMGKNWKISSNTPEVDELVESGEYREAQHDLMRSEGHEVLSHLEELAIDAGYDLVKKKKHATEYCHNLEEFPIERILREGCFVTGGRGSGKTNLQKLLVQKALSRKIRVKVIDTCLAWKTYPLERIKVNSEYVPNLWNRVYDLSRLSVLETRSFVSDMLQRDTKEGIISTDMGYKPSCLIVIEEAQNVIPSNSLRSKQFMEISRFITQGRNFGMSYIASTQRPASVDINLIENSGVNYWFRLQGARNIQKARYWLSKFETWKLRDLETGMCYLQIGSKVKLLRLPKFEEQRIVIG